MAEKHLANGGSPEGKPILVLPGMSSKEPSPSRPSELQPYTPNRISSPSSQSNVVVPVRLDVLLFLLNSAARGAQYALPPASIQGGQGSPSVCHQGPAVQPVPNCCGCPPTCQSTHQSSGTQQYRGSYGSHGGVMENLDNRSYRDRGNHRSDGKSWSGGNSTGGWKVFRPPMGCPEKLQGEARGRDNGDDWQGRRQSFGRAWGDRRHSTAGSASQTSSSQEWRKEGSAFGYNHTKVKRIQEGCLRPPWDAPDAKRSSDNSRMGWQKSQGTRESISFPGRPVGDGPAKPAIQENEEDWEADYENGQTNHPAPGAVSCSSRSDIPADPAKEDVSASTASPPRMKQLISPLPEEATKAQEVATAKKPAATSCMDPSKNGGFLSYLKNLYSDLPRKSSSEDSSELVIDTDVESSKPEEEEQSLEKEVGGESKSQE